MDINEIAVHLARLSLWIHTFVPGLPLSFLDHNIVCGNSLVGIATFDEVDELLTRGRTMPLFDHTADALIGSATATVKRLGELSDADAAEIKAARQAFAEQKRVVAPTARMLDILTASRLPDSEIDVLVDDFDMENELFVQSLHRRANNVLGELTPFHFPIAFPGVFLRERAGFDVILGNPPWKEATLEEDDFWSRYVPGLQAQPQHDQEAIKRGYRKDRPDLVEQFQRELAAADELRAALVTGPYPGMGTGDPDLYKAFCWRFWNLINRDGGRIGVVLPRSALCAKGSREFRFTAFAQASTDVTFLVNNRLWVFPEGHPQWTYGLTSLTKKADGDHRILLRGPFASLERFVRGAQQPPVTFKAEEVLSWTDTAALPLLPAEESAQVFGQLRKARRLDLDDDQQWRARPHTELHATNDKPLMALTDNPPKGFWPVFKGESFEIWEPDRGVYYGWADPEKMVPHLQKKRERGQRNSRSPFFEFTDSNWFRKPETLPCQFVRLAFRDVSRATDTRTVRAALLPPKCFITNKGPYFLWPRGDEVDQAYLLGILSSIPLDWYARRFVETNLNYHVLNPFPVPRPGRDHPLWQRTVELAGRLACPDKRFANWAKAVGVEFGPLDAAEKDDMIHELDAVVAHLYGLNESQLRHIFETFHEGWDYRPRLEAVLEHFRGMGEEGRSGIGT